MLEATTSTSRDVLTEVLREGAQRLLTTVIEAKMAEYIDTHQHIVNGAGCRQVVRNGSPLQRTIQTGITSSMR